VNTKKRVIKDYDSLPELIREHIKMAYPRGFAQHLLHYTDHKGKHVSALPFDTKNIYYLVRMTISEAIQIIEDDDDYDNDGKLKEGFSLTNKKEDEAIFENAPEEEEVVFKDSTI